MKHVFLFRCVGTHMRARERLDLGDWARAGARNRTGPFRCSVGSKYWAPRSAKTATTGSARPPGWGAVAQRRRRRRNRFVSNRCPSAYQYMCGTGCRAGRFRSRVKCKVRPCWDEIFSRIYVRCSVLRTFVPITQISLVSAAVFSNQQ